MKDRTVLILAGGAVLLGLYVKNKAAAAVNAVNPVNPDNIFNRGVESVGQNVTGDPHWSPGGAAYDFIHKPWDINDPNSKPNEVDWKKLLLGPVWGDWW